MLSFFFFSPKEWRQMEWKFKEDLMQLLKNGLVVKDLMRCIQLEYLLKRMQEIF